MTGSVIDHLSDRHVADQDVPVFGDILPAVAAAMAEAVRLRESARLELAGMIDDLRRRLPPLARPVRRCDGWVALAAALGRSGRIDAVFHDPLVADVRRALLDMGGVRVGDVATASQPGRTKRLYIGYAHGRPMLSGAQLLQTRPINLQYVHPESLGKPSKYELRAGQIAYQADGRSEESLGTPALITRDRDGWLASEHIGRIDPKPDSDPGWLFLALKMPQALVQIKAASSGSVIDETSPSDMSSVVLPPPRMVRGDAVMDCWDRFCQANDLEARAVRMVDAALAGG